MKKHVNYQQGVLTIDPDPIIDASGTSVSEVIEAFTSQSDDILSASIGSSRNLGTDRLRRTFNVVARIWNSRSS